jgi:hypothetical protein
MGDLVEQPDIEEEVKEGLPLMEEAQEDGSVPPVPDQPVERVRPKLTSLDVVAWAYLKEELVNTPESAEVKHMKQHFPNLIAFVAYIDGYLAGIESGDDPLPDTHKVVWNQNNDNARIVNSFLQKTSFNSPDRFITSRKVKNADDENEEETIGQDTEKK